MGLFAKKTLKELLEQRPDRTLANQVSAMFYPDPTWAFEKDTGLPVMFRFETSLGSVPYSVHWLGQKDKQTKAIGRDYHNETVNVYTYLDILGKRGCPMHALVPVFVELYGMKENLIDRCGSMERLFADASWASAMERLAKAEEMHHPGAVLVRKELQKIPKIEKLFPYSLSESFTETQIVEFCENQEPFLTGLLREARDRSEQATGPDNPAAEGYSELKNDIRTVILWLAMHKVPWALRAYCDGTLIEDSRKDARVHFPVGYYYSNIDPDYHRDFGRRDKAYAYSMEKSFALLKEADSEYAEMKKRISIAEGTEPTEDSDEILSSGTELYNNGHYQEAFDRLTPLAEENNADALHLCALMLLNGQVRPVGWSMTFRLLESEYDRGNTTVAELICDLYRKKGSRTSAVFWGERGLKDGFPDCMFILACMFQENSEEYLKYIHRGADAGSVICSYYWALDCYLNSNFSRTRLDNARANARKALDGGIEQARELLNAIDEKEREWDISEINVKLMEMDIQRDQDERDRRESADYWKKELKFLSSLNDPYTARDSTGRVLTVDPTKAEATDGTNTYKVSEVTLKNNRAERMLNRND